MSSPVDSKWEKNMIPFLALSSGDYICIDVYGSHPCAVNFYDHEYRSFEKISDSFEGWIKMIPEFFEGW
jgi:hypothetical protein